MPVTKRLGAEFLGTFWLVFGGCGSAVIAAGWPDLGIGFAGVSLAFGLTVLTAAYAFAHISGAHFNPAVSLGLAVAGRFAWKDLGPYVVAQVLGGIVAALLLQYVASGAPGFSIADGLASNGYGDHSPGGYTLQSALVIEVLLTGFFLLVILGATSVNPARSTGPAIMVGDWALAQLWLFWVAPLAGAALAGFVHRWLARDTE